MSPEMVMAAWRYVVRCWVAGDTRPTRVLLGEIVAAELAAELQYQMYAPWI